MGKSGQRFRDLHIDPALLPYDSDIVVAHYRALEKLEEEFSKNARCKKVIKHISLIGGPVLALYTMLNFVAGYLPARESYIQGYSKTEAENSRHLPTWSDNSAVLPSPLKSLTKPGREIAYLLHAK